jgi:hypothetical protein
MIQAMNQNELAKRMSDLERWLQDTSIRAPYSDERREMRKELARLRVIRSQR